MEICQVSGLVHSTRRLGIVSGWLIITRKTETVFEAGSQVHELPAEELLIKVGKNNQ